MKRPAFQFYPADWRKDVELQSCSMTAQGLWINAMCLAHECEPYGHLTVNGNAMSTAQLGRHVGLSGKDVQTLLAELFDAGVARKTAEGTVYSKRMVDDEQLRNTRADAGRLGGNPALLGNKDKRVVKQTSKQSPTPSSSSSTSIPPAPPVGGRMSHPEKQTPATPLTVPSDADKATANYLAEQAEHAAKQETPEQRAASLAQLRATRAAIVTKEAA